MGVVKFEGKHSFPGGHIWVLWDAGEEDEYGYEIDVPGEEGIGGVLVTVLNWSFGYEDWSRDVWTKWGDYVNSRFEAIAGDEEAFAVLVEELESINCTYQAYQDELFREEHLVDLDRIKELIKSVE